MSASPSNLVRLAITLIAVTSAGSSACSSSDDIATSSNAACSGSPRRTSALFDRDVSFAREVLPIFQETCAYTSCHGTPNRNGLYLSPVGRSAASAVRSLLLETAPRASMPFVTPGQPERSWLLRKIEGDYCGIACEGGCGDRMPKGSGPLEPAQITTIATWIAKGAPDN